MAVATLRTETLVESRPKVLELEEDEAETLNALGRKLASDRGWWGETGGEDGEIEVRTAVRCSPVGGGRWSVTVDNAVGTVSAGGVQLIIRPKILQTHLLHLFAKAGSWPRMDESLAPLSIDSDLVDLVVRWYLSAVERLLRGDLMRDYRETRDDLEAVRGRIDAIGTTQLLYSGRFAAVCDFEVFDVDIALNRVLKAAARAILGNPVMAPESRRRAERVAVRMDEVGTMRAEDLDVSTDRRTAAYYEPLLLARHILAAQGRSLSRGGASARAFLFRTPELVEKGVRNILLSGLVDLCEVKKEGRQLEASTLRINPDLRFDPVAVGDVKYKVNWGAWVRSDLYQSVAFAAGFRVDYAVIVTFCDDSRDDLIPARFGDVIVEQLQWRGVPGFSPDMAELRFINDARAWWVKIRAQTAQPVRPG